MQAAPPPASRLAYGLTVGTFCLLWSSAFSMAKLAMADCPPLLFLVVRFAIGAGVAFAIAAARGVDWRMRPRDVLGFALVGILSNAVYLGFTYSGMQAAPSGLAAIISSTNPVLTAALATPLLGETMTARKAAGLVLGIAGVALLVESRVSHGSASLAGILLLLAGLLSLVASTLLFKRLQPKGSLWLGNAIQTLASALVLAPVAFASESIAAIHPSWQLIFVLTWLTLLGSVLAYFLWLRLLTLTDATTASAWHFMMPPLGLLFAWLLLGERVPAADLIGILPVVLGIYLVTRAPAATPSSSRERKRTPWHCPPGRGAMS